MKVVTS